MRTYRIIDESRFDGLTPDKVAALVAAEKAGQPAATIVVTWDQLAAVNEPETMEEIGALAPGERTTLGMCDDIERVA